MAATKREGKAKGQKEAHHVMRFPPKWFNQGRLLETMSLIIYRNSEVQGLEPKPEHLSLLSCQYLVIMLRVSPTYPTWLFSSIQREKVMMINFFQGLFYSNSLCLVEQKFMGSPPHPPSKEFTSEECCRSLK